MCSRARQEETIWGEATRQEEQGTLTLGEKGRYFLEAHSLITGRGDSLSKLNGNGVELAEQRKLFATYVGKEQKRDCVRG